jgi:hypothetical protein
VGRIRCSSRSVRICGPKAAPRQRLCQLMASGMLDSHAV